MATGLNLDAVVLAAGAGARFGGEKLTSPWNGTTLLAESLRTAFGAPVRSVVVVAGADPKVVAIASAAGARVVHAAAYAEGLSASLKAGVGALPADCDGAFIFLGDMPRVPPGVAAALAAVLPGREAAAPVSKGRRGHPVLLGRTLFPAVAALSGDHGAGALLAALGHRLARVETDDEGVFFDVDRRES